MQLRELQFMLLPMLLELLLLLPPHFFPPFPQVPSGRRAEPVVRRPLHLRRHEPHRPLFRPRAVRGLLPPRLEALHRHPPRAGRHGPVGHRALARLRLRDVQEGGLLLAVRRETAEDIFLIAYFLTTA